MSARYQSLTPNIQKPNSVKQVLFLLLFCIIEPLLAQENGKGEYVYGLFRGTRVVNGQSVESQKEGELDFIIAHRFDQVNGGAYELFGLDQASMRWGLEYGITNNIVIGMGRSSVGKVYDGFFKARLLKQTKGRKWNIPLSVTLYTSAAINTLRPIDNQPVLFQSRLSYNTQLLIARKFGASFSIQLMPSYTHFNLVEARNDANDIFSTGIAAKYQVSKNIGITVEYYHNLPNQLPTGKHNPLSIGVDINTGNHVFQLHFTNSRHMLDQYFITDTIGDWLDGDIHIGFNMVRTFKLKGRRY